ncbi:hypothetical protein HK105_200835 [Polyrhizophydium stewartii]|uniref:Uncharacterized protein n=1 Tax=Polyrhizophydium stewartii TaxID=2732419 RepID=A0ABR4NK61_9FUNG
MDGSGDDTLRRVLLGIPAMSPAISDPARHEKVLSFVAGLCSQAPAATVARLSGDLDALGVLCPAIPHPADDRITSLALRILGVLVAASAAGSPAGSGAPRVPVFQSLRKRYPPVLDHILLLGPDRGEAGDAESKSAIDLFGCLETLGMWLACDAAVAWMSDECERIRDLVLHAFETQNLFVVRSCCRLVLGILTLDRPASLSHARCLHAALVGADALPQRLAEMADAGATADDKIAVLELAWLVAESAHPGAIELLVDCDLVMVCFDLLADMDRIVQHRAVDVLILLFSQQARHGTRLISQPAHTLLQSDFDFVVSSILVRRECASPTARQCAPYFGVLEILWHTSASQDARDALRIVLQSALDVVLAGGSGVVALNAPFAELGHMCTRAHSSIASSLRAGSAAQQRAARQMSCDALVSAICRLAESSPQQLADLLLVLLSPHAACPPKPLTSGLVSLAAILRSNQSMPALSASLLWSAIQPLAEPGPKDDYSIPLLKALLDLLLLLVECGGAECEPCVASWMQQLLVSGTWDAQDVALEATTRVFSAGHSTPVSKALSSRLDVIHCVASCLKSPSSFVRSSALGCLACLISDPEMHIHLASTPGLVAEIVPMMTGDPEAFVRRAAVSLVALLVGDPAAARRLIVDNNGVPAAITASSIGKCCFDDDLEVRVQAVRLLVALFGRADDVALAADPDEHPFFVVDGDRHFVSMLDDPSRLVRQQALEGVLALRSMHIDTALRDAKRERHAGSRADAFLSRLAAVDTEEMRMRCIPEHLYQEALDMDASVLNESNERGEGNNVLYCYDC